jgi:predicted DNA-binding transcriptional regulator AlpA
MSKDNKIKELNDFRLITAGELAPILGITPTAIRIRICRGGVENGTVPPPVNLDNVRHYWSIATVREWLEAKAAEASAYQADRGRGRPRLPRETKSENRRAA